MTHKPLKNQSVLNNCAAGYDHQLRLCNNQGQQLGNQALYIIGIDIVVTIGHITN